MKCFSLVVVLLLVACDDGAVTVNDPISSRQTMSCPEYVASANQQRRDGVLSLESWVRGFKKYCPEAEERTGIPGAHAR